MRSSARAWTKSIGTAVLSGLTVTQETGRRRAITAFSRPDVGQPTLAEPLAFHAHAIDRAGAASDWSQTQRTWIISITSAA